MKLSIIIPTWNTAKITQKSIKTIINNLDNFNYEIIVIDNGSSDNTVELLSKIPKVKLIKNQKNLGFAKANNQAVKIAKGNYFLFLNSDMELIDSSLIKMYQYLIDHPKVGAIGPQLLNIDHTPQASVFPPQTALNAFKEFWLGIKNSYSKYLPDTKNISQVWAISGGAFLIEKKFFQKIGSWNEKYFFYFEDLDLCRAVHQAGKSIVFYPFCQIVHHHGASGKSLADASNQWRRLIPSSIIFHGHFMHSYINFIIWSGQKFHHLFCHSRY